MSDLAKTLLTQYYGLGAESNGKRFLSIHQSVENTKRDEEKVTEQISSTIDEEDVTEEEYQEDNDKLSVAEHPYSGVFDDEEDTYDFNENFDIDLGPNWTEFFETTQSSVSRDRSPDAIKETIKKSVADTNDSKDTNDNDLSLTFMEDGFLDSASEDSSMTLEKSPTSSKVSTNLRFGPKKEPVYNETFADYSATELKQFPIEIFGWFPYLRMLYMADNNLTELPDDTFTCLKCLEWLDARNNKLSTLPSTIKFHSSLETLLLQGNKIENLPLELCTLPKLKTLQVAQNPLITPPQDIVASGYSAVWEFLRIEWNNAHPEEWVEPKENKIEPKLSTILCYQSPRKSKKKNLPSRSAVRSRNPSAVERRKSYRPGNRYHDEKLFLINNTNDSTFCDSCLTKLADLTITQKRKRNKIVIPMNNRMEEVNDKVLCLMGPSPRSLYVRRNIKILKTYQRPVKRECKNIDFDNSVNTENKIFPGKNTKFPKYKNYVERQERVFDIVTKDGKRFKLNPMRLNDPGWILSCLENYVGINKCENKGANISVEHRSFWFSKLKEFLTKQASILQKVKDENVLKQWRRDTRSFYRSIEKAMKRNADDIPFGFDLEDYALIFKQNAKSDNRGSKISGKQKFVPPKDINKKINELLTSLNELEVKDLDTQTPRTKQNLFKNEIEKILQFQNEIQNLQKHNDVATVS